jgi:hypothetical protein
MSCEVDCLVGRWRSSVEELGEEGRLQRRKKK